MIEYGSNAEAEAALFRGGLAAQRAGGGLPPAKRERGSLDGLARAAVVQALEMLPEAVFFLNADLRIMDANAAAERSSGYRRAELRKMRLDNTVWDNGDGRLSAGVDRLLSGTVVDITLRGRWRSKNGDSRAAQLHLRCVRAEAQEPLLVAVVRGAKEDRRPAARSRGARRDDLTGLPPRATLKGRLRRAKRRARRTQSRFAVLFIDLDEFKSVNDTAGHRVGDMVLQTFARRLLSSLRPGDFVARYGGDEFVALIEDVRSEEEAKQLAARLRARVAAPIRAMGARFQMSASVGVALGDGHSSLREVVDQADRAMYRVKQSRSTAEARPVVPPAGLAG